MGFMQSPAEMLKLAQAGAIAPYSGGTPAGGNIPTAGGGNAFQTWQSILPHDVAAPQHPDQFVPNSHPFMQGMMQQWQQQGTPFMGGVAGNSNGGGVAPTVGG